MDSKISPSSSNLRVKFSNPSPDKLRTDSKTFSQKDFKNNHHKKIETPQKLATVGDVDTLKLDLDSLGFENDDYFSENES